MKLRPASALNQRLVVWWSESKVVPLFKQSVRRALLLQAYGSLQPPPEAVSAIAKPFLTTFQGRFPLSVEFINGITASGGLRVDDGEGLGKITGRRRALSWALSVVALPCSCKV